MVDLVKRLEIMSGMLTMGEKIAWGSDAALMDEAKAEIERLREGIREISKACLDGRVCDDVAWFTEIQTLNDYCEALLSEARQ